MKSWGWGVRGWMLKMEGMATESTTKMWPGFDGRESSTCPQASSLCWVTIKCQGPTMTVTVTVSMSSVTATVASATKLYTRHQLNSLCTSFQPYDTLVHWVVASFRLSRMKDKLKVTQLVMAEPVFRCWLAEAKVRLLTTLPSTNSEQMSPEELKTEFMTFDTKLPGASTCFLKCAMAWIWNVSHKIMTWALGS